ncbi:MAG: hypothetical protein QW265_05755 [Candidatus Bathyarchaeia archaeon]
MKSRRAERLKRKEHKLKPKEIFGFIALAILMVLIVYLIVVPSPSQIEEQGKPMPKTATTPTKAILGKAAIVDQLGLRMPNPGFIEQAKAIMEASGFKVDVYTHDQATVELYRSISAKGYKLIIFRVHMGVNDQAKDKPVGMFTSEPYSELEYTIEQLKDQVGSAKAYNTTEVLFAISPKFIEECLVMDYPGTIIILTGCFGLYSEALPKAFLDRGASVVIGWDGLVGIEHTDEATVILLRMMLIEKMSVEKSVKATMNILGPDPNNGSILEYYPKGKGNLIL